MKKEEITKNKLWWLSWVVLIVCLGVTFFGAYAFKQRIKKDAEQAFNQLVDEIQQTIKSRMFFYENTLTALKALVEASENIHYGSFKHFYNTLYASKNHPEIFAMGFIEYVPHDSLSEFISTTRQQGLPEFKVRLKQKASDYMILKFSAPFRQNHQGIGVDLGANLERRQVLEHARDEANIYFSPKIRLVVGKMKPALVLYAPVYKKSANITSSVIERRKALIGWVSLPFLIQDLMQKIFSDRQLKFLKIRLYDGEKISDKALFYSSHKI